MIKLLDFFLKISGVDLELEIIYLIIISLLFLNKIHTKLRGIIICILVTP